MVIQGKDWQCCCKGSEFDLIDTLDFSKPLSFSIYIEFMAKPSEVWIFIDSLRLGKHAESEHLLVALVTMTGC